MKPPLKWAGGKRWLVPRLELMYRQAGKPRLVEPFVGGLAVALGLAPARALLSDHNPHLVNFYRALQEGLTVDLEMKNEEGCYYRNRDRFNRLVRDGEAEGAEAAALFYYLNRTGYNGLCRFNSKGLFNVPFGKYASINYVYDFSAYREWLSRWELRCSDFERLCLERSDFLYADPPYDVEFTKYSKDDFKWDDQQRLAEWLCRHEGPVVASNQATPRILDLYSALGFELEIVPAPRMISCNGDRSKAEEMLAWRNLTSS